jgi:hypothetical protein
MEEYIRKLILENMIILLYTLGEEKATWELIQTYNSLYEKFEIPKPKLYLVK